MALGYVTSVRNAQLQALADLVNGGAGPGKLRIYSGTRPATGGAATTLLAELALSDPMQNDITGGVLTFDPISDDTTADATGTATWFRILDSNNVPLVDGSVSGIGGGGDLELDNTSIVAGGVVEINTGTITAGNA